MDVFVVEREHKHVLIIDVLKDHQMGKDEVLFFFLSVASKFLIPKLYHFGVCFIAHEMRCKIDSKWQYIEWLVCVFKMYGKSNKIMMILFGAVVVYDNFHLCSHKK